MTMSSVAVLRRRRGLAALAELQRRVPIAQLASIVVLYLVGAATVDGFSSRLSLYSMLVLASLLGISAAGQTLVVLINGLDLAISAFIVAGATMTVKLTTLQGWPFPATIAVIVASALAAGAIAGLICHDLRLQPVVVTLALGAVVTGAILVWTRGSAEGVAPGWLGRLVSPSGRTLGLELPPIVVIWAIIAAALGFVLHSTTFGRWLYAVGANPRAAALVLVPTRRVWMVAFALSALSAAVAGVLLAGFAGAGDSSVGDPYLFQGLTAVIVGGTTFGGRGDYWRTVIGALLLTELTTVMVGHGYGQDDQEILSGIAILLVVFVYGRNRRLRDRI
ncbi:MAG: ABC transporter permease [Solirubrobacteraceae bacterium]